jgi:hypothetical protein
MTDEELERNWEKVRKSQTRNYNNWKEW